MIPMADVDHREFMAVVEQKQWMNRRASTDEGNSFQGGSSRSNTVYPIARFVYFLWVSRIGTNDDCI